MILTRICRAAVGGGAPSSAACTRSQSAQIDQAALWWLALSESGACCLLEARTHERKAQAAAAKSFAGEILLSPASLRRIYVSEDSLPLLELILKSWGRVGMGTIEGNELPV